LFLFFFVDATKKETNPKKENAIPAVARSHFPFVFLALKTQGICWELDSF